MHPIVPVILSGGIGSRLWPESRRERPKQLAHLVGTTSLLQVTAMRAATIPGASPPIVVCGVDHHGVITAQLEEVGVAPLLSILEPAGRSTGPAAAVAALSVERDDIILLLPADHLITDNAAFVDAVEAATFAAAAGYLVTFGTQPTRPDTGFGYIEHGGALDLPGTAAKLSTVAQFVEKPDAGAARRYLNDGGYSWNSGMFVFRAGTFLDELSALAPDLLACTRAALRAAERTANVAYLDRAEFTECRSQSIDYAVMERTERAAVMPLDAGWNDVGTWAALWDVAEKDENGNVVTGNAYVETTTNSYIRASTRALAAVGLDGVIIVDTDDAVLVVHRDHAQDVRHIVERLSAEGSDLVERHQR